MIKLFQKILQDTHRVSNGVGHAEITRLNKALRYWHQRERALFLYGNGSVGVLDT